MLSPFIAFRYIFSRKDSKFISLISVISFSGIALGVAVLIIALTILDGFEKVIEDKIVSFNSHIQISSFSKKNLDPYQDFMPGIARMTGQDIASISPFIYKAALIKHKKYSEGIMLKGIIPENDNSDINKYIVSGKYKFGNSNKPGIILGKKLAEKLFVEIGSKITLFTLRNDMAPSFDNPPAIKQFVVTGIYESGMAEYDDLNAYCEFEEAQNFFEIGNHISGYNIKLKKLDNIFDIEEKLQNGLPYPYYVRSIYQVHQNIFTWIDLQKKPIPIILGLIVVVAVFNIVGTLLMIVLERTSDIGILRAMGSTKKQIISIFMIQGISLSLIGIILGNIIAFTLSYLQLEFDIISLPAEVYFISSVPISINVLNYLIVSGSAFVLSIFISIIPCSIAAGLSPITSIKFD